jgi:hypothetical protein
MLQILKRAAGFGDAGTVLSDGEGLEFETRIDAFRPVPEPSILEREQMEIDAKREILTIDVENFDTAAEYHEKQAAIFRAKKADTLRILDGLRLHEEVVNAPMREALDMVGADIDAALDGDSLHEQMADAIEKSLKGKRSRKPALAAAE